MLFVLPRDVRECSGQGEYLQKWHADMPDTAYPALVKVGGQLLRVSARPGTQGIMLQRAQQVK